MLQHPHRPSPNSQPKSHGSKGEPLAEFQEAEPLGGVWGKAPTLPCQKRFRLACDVGQRAVREGRDQSGGAHQFLERR